MKALVLSIIIAVSGSFAFASQASGSGCTSVENYFGNTHSADGALTRGNAVQHVTSTGQVVVDADSDGITR